jgi:hypothetical protein
MQVNGPGEHVTSDRREFLLHWAAAVSTMVIGLLAIFPGSYHEHALIAAPWRYIFGGIFGIILVGFHFSMLIECLRARGRWTLMRIAFVILMLLVPIAPAVIYLLFTRSRTFSYQG